MSTFKKIKPAFWDDKDVYESHPHEPLNFQFKWKLIVIFTSFTALLPLMALAVIEYKLTFRTFEEEMKKNLYYRLQPAARSLIDSIDRQVSNIDHLIVKHNFQNGTPPIKIQEIQQALSSLSGNTDPFSVINHTQGNIDNGDDSASCSLHALDTIDLTGEIKRQRFITYRQQEKNEPAGLVVDLCYSSIKSDHITRFGLRFPVSFLDYFFESYQQDLSDDIFIVEEKGILVTPSRFYGSQGQATGFNPNQLIGSHGVIDSVTPEKKILLIGYAQVPNSSIMLIMAKDKRYFKDLWFNPRLKLLGFFIASIFLILLCIMGMATYLIGRIHTADKKRLRALHHAGYANKLTSIGRLASGVAHEINNPLAIINEKTGLMIDLMELEKEHIHNDRLFTLARDVINAVERCGTVTKGLMDFSKTMEPCIETVDIEQTVNEILTFFYKRAKDKEITISFKSKGKAFLLDCDRGGLQQVILNLLNNAFTAMEEGGSLDILVTFNREKHISLSVSDTGCGIPEENIHNVFEPFFTVNDNPSGTGIGLYVTFGIVKKMGGRIFAQSSLGKGSTFTVTLPIISESKPVGDRVPGQDDNYESTK